MHQNLDQATWEHLQTWLQKEFEWCPERRAPVEADIMLALADDPTLIERHSWPEIQELGRVSRDYQERKARGFSVCVWAVPIKGRNGFAVGSPAHHHGMSETLKAGDTFKANGKHFRVLKILTPTEAAGLVAIER